MLPRVLSAPVLIDARAAARPELGGVERWARELAARLPLLAPGRYAVATPRPRLTHRLGHAWEQLALPARARGHELLLCPANLAPLASDRALLVLHDVAPLEGPDWYAPAYVAWQRALLPRLARRARQLVTVSEFSRAQIRETLGVDAAVVPGGVDHTRLHPGVAPADLGRPYVLTLASRTGRKNLAALAPLAARLHAEGAQLVLAGGGRPQFAGGDGAIPHARDLGHVDDADLPGLYAGADAFVLPSLHEGFGLTCLEAMACGTPVVAARAGALPETCAGAARYADPRDPDDIATQALAARADDPAPGLARAAEFSWDRTAREMDALAAAALIRHDTPS